MFVHVPFNDEVYKFYYSNSVFYILMMFLCTSTRVYIVRACTVVRYEDVYVNQGEEYALRLLELEANFLSIFFDFFDL